MSELHQHRGTFYTVTCSAPYRGPAGMTQCNASQTYPSKRDAEVAKKAHDECFHKEKLTAHVSGARWGSVYCAPTAEQFTEDGDE